MPKKRKKRNAPQIKKIIIVFLAIAIMALFLLLLYSPPNKISVQQDEDKNFRDAQTNQIIPLEKIDFPSSEEGTFSGWVKESYFKEPIDEKVVLFSSGRIPGLVLIYYTKENKLIAGLPQMSAENIFLFNDQRHHLAYTFKEGGWQFLYYDGKQVATSEFQPYPQTEITGLATGIPPPAVSEAFQQIEIN